MLSLSMVSIIGVICLYALIGIGPSVPIQMPADVAGFSGNAVWILILFGYAAIASLLPVWMLLQPRDYINGLQLFIGLIILYGAIVLLNPTLVAPAFNDNVPAGTPSLLPLLFVTIAALLIQLRSFYEQGNMFLLVLDLVVLVAAIMVAMECASALKRSRAEMAAEQK